MLCDPALYSGTQRVLFTRKLSNGQIFAIRHFSVDHDIHRLLDEFLRKVDGWGLDSMLEHFQGSYGYIAGSHTSQAFIVSIDEEPIFEIEVHDGIGHQPNLGGIRSQQGDYILNIAAGFWNKTGLNIYGESLRWCAKYFFGFSEVKRLVINSGSVSASLLPAVALSSGFRQLPKAPGVYMLELENANSNEQNEVC